MSTHTNHQVAIMLVDDGLSPLFDPRCERTSTAAAREAIAALATPQEGPALVA